MNECSTLKTITRLYDIEYLLPRHRIVYPCTKLNPDIVEGHAIQAYIYIFLKNIKLDVPNERFFHPIS